VLAAFATAPNPSDPLAALEVGDRPEPDVPDGWTTVEVRAASLNHHDLWTLRGVGIAKERFPMILGCDASGVDSEGRDVVVHSVIADPGWAGDETLDPGRTLLSEVYQGSFAERVAVPVRNLVPKPPEVSHEEAACLGTAWTGGGARSGARQAGVARPTRATRATRTAVYTQEAAASGLPRR